MSAVCRRTTFQMWIFKVNMAFVSPNNVEKGGYFGGRLLFGLFSGKDARLCGGRRLGGRAGTEMLRRHPFSGSAKATAGALLKNRLSLIIWGGELSPSFLFSGRGGAAYYPSTKTPFEPWVMVVWTGEFSPAFMLLRWLFRPFRCCSALPASIPP